MTRGIGLVLFLVVCIGAQPFKDLLLPTAVQFHGTVVDRDGKPIQEVRIDHTGDMRILYQTDTEGKFDLLTKAPSVVFRKAGFRSEFVKTGSGEMRVVMAAMPHRSYAICPDTNHRDSIDGWGASFWFPRVQGVSASKQVRDSDYGARGYTLQTAAGPRGISHGSGPMWDFGMPLDRDVWKSAEYQETTFEDGKLTITDARGKFANGNQWRYLGAFGESAEYSDVEPAAARTLDLLFDGACRKH